MSGPAGERLEPVEPGEMREGDEVIGTPKPRPPRPQIRGILVVPDFPLNDDAVSIKGIGGITASAYTWQRVVAEPPLPTAPGAVIDAVVGTDPGGAGWPARLMRVATPGGFPWLADRLILGQYGVADRHIRPGWRQVSPETEAGH